MSKLNRHDTKCYVANRNVLACQRLQDGLLIAVVNINRVFVQ